MQMRYTNNLHRRLNHVYAKKIKLCVLDHSCISEYKYLTLIFNHLYINLQNYR